MIVFRAFVLGLGPGASPLMFSLLVYVSRLCFGFGPRRKPTDVLFMCRAFVLDFGPGASPQLSQFMGFLSVNDAIHPGYQHCSHDALCADAVVM